MISFLAAFFKIIFFSPSFPRMLSSLPPSCRLSTLRHEARHEAASHLRCLIESSAAALTTQRSERFNRALAPPPTATATARRRAAGAASASASSALPPPPPPPPRHHHHHHHDLSPWLCPVCSAPLSFSEDVKSLSCAQNHCYDLAKEGYVNLVRSGRKAKKAGAALAGDAPESLAARGRFFAAGHFDRVMDAAAEAVLRVLERGREKGTEATTTATVLDAGCGEGAYLRRLGLRLSSSSASSSSSSSSIYLLGVDVAKAAVRSAASRAQREEEKLSNTIEAHFAVASAFALPLRDSSVSCALVAFAPLPSAELRRVLIDDDRNSAAVVIVGPGPGHFLGLKKEVYGEERARRRNKLDDDDDDEEEEEEKISSTLPKTSSQTRVRYQLSLDGPAAFDLLQMTPYWWKASEDTKKRVREEGFETEVDVLVSVVERAELDVL